MEQVQKRKVIRVKTYEELQAITNWSVKSRVKFRCENCGKLHEVTKIAAERKSHGMLLCGDCKRAETHAVYNRNAEEKRRRKVTAENPYRRHQDNKLYGIYKNLRQRFFCPSTRDYKYYGGRGIKLAPEWLDFDTFVTWSLDNGFQFDKVLGRKNMNGNFTPENCVFRTKPDNTKAMNDQQEPWLNRRYV